MRAYDPAAMPNTKVLHPDLHYAEDVYDCASGADALVLVTDWNAVSDARPAAARGADGGEDHRSTCGTSTSRRK